MSKACQKHSAPKHSHGHVHFGIVLGVIFVLLAVMYQIFTFGYSAVVNTAELYGRITSLEEDVKTLTEENEQLWTEMDARGFFMNLEDEEHEQEENVLEEEF